MILFVNNQRFQFGSFLVFFFHHRLFFGVSLNLFFFCDKTLNHLFSAYLDMVMSLCRHTPSRNALSIRAQELVFHPYEHDAYEKEKIQPDDHPYEVTDLPIKVKLSNI